jgi:hypothetical protein
MKFSTSDLLCVASKKATSLLMPCSSGNFGPDWEKGILYAIFAVQAEGNVHKFKESEIHP